MKAEYDFSQGERGKFYTAEAEFSFPIPSLPIQLESDVNDRMSRLAEENGVDIQTLVNEWLRANLKVIESLQP